MIDKNLDINLSALEDETKTFSEKIKESGLSDNLNICTQCGACVSSCTAARITDFNIRHILDDLRLGREDVLEKDDIWNCFLCDSCYVRCPREITPSLFIIILRMLALEKGYGWDLVSKMEKYGRNLYETGMSILPQDPDLEAPIDLLKDRDMESIFEEMGIKRREIKKESLQELQKILEVSRYKERIELIESKIRSKGGWFYRFKNILTSRKRD